MSALWLKLIAILCLSCTALSDPAKSGVLWRDLGGSVTIQCRAPETNLEYLTLTKSFTDIEVFNIGSNKRTVATEFTGRLQSNGAFPDVDILIKNLTSDDMGVYLCIYKRFDQQSNKLMTTTGTGSVLLVVKDYKTDATPQQCEPSNKNLVLVPVVISAALLVVIFLILLTWIIHKTKTQHTTVKPRRVTTNDVYEDMRGTLRR